MENEIGTKWNNCPFCGSFLSSLITDEENNEHWIMCNGCSCRGPSARMIEQDAVDYWNKRTEDIHRFREPNEADVGKTVLVRNNLEDEWCHGWIFKGFSMDEHPVAEKNNARFSWKYCVLAD